MRGKKIKGLNIFSSNKMDLESYFQSLDLSVKLDGTLVPALWKRARREVAVLHRRCKLEESSASRGECGHEAYASLGSCGSTLC